MLSGLPTRAPLYGLILYCCALLGIIILLFTHSFYWPLVILLMIIVHHGTHEAVHDTLVPNGSKHTSLASFFAWVGFAVLGHNYILMRWSHQVHHRYGRRKREFTIDGQALTFGRLGTVWYYLCLLGASSIYHELAGYLYPVLGDKYHILSRRFKKRYYRNYAYLMAQAGVLVMTLSLFWLGGTRFLICKLIFTLYWGAFQNVAHYGLEINSGPESRLAARTYRIPRVLEFLIFRAGVYHLEHHTFPRVPGLNLSSPVVLKALEEEVGFCPVPKRGLMRYLGDCLKQYRGPKATADRWKPVETQTPQ